MPKSKSKRNRYVPPPKPKPKPSPKWIPYAFFGMLGVGFLMIIGRYILGSTMAVFDSNWLLWAGLGLIAGAFSLATQWR